ncbi:MAG TPA: ATPase domain-containing protein, partial [Thermoanaerobaculia bacterium]|nr:ATPase domain-containing protein [Thermoanaerobaculia bacterium]
MSRRKGVTTVFACQSCGAVAPKWLGRCPDCGEWNSYVEEVRGEPPEAPAASGSAPISAVSVQPEPRISTALAGLDRVLGGGIVPGSVVLFGGEPGIGKSTLLLQAARGIARAAGEVLYVSGEESASQVRLRGERIGIREERLLVLAETDVTRVIG